VRSAHRRADALRAPAAPPAAPPPGRWTDRSLSTHEDHTCATTEAGVVCWGENTGVETDDAVTPRPTPVRVPTISADDLVAVQVRFRSGCALHATGALSCWSRGVEQTAPTFHAGVVDFALGDGPAICALLATGELACKALRYPDPRREVPPGSPPSWEPFPTPELGAVRRVMATLNGFCAIHSDGQLSCWDARKPAAASPDVDDAVRVSAYSNQGRCAVRRRGQVVCSGGGRIVARLSRVPGTALRGSLFEVPAVDDAVDVATGKDHGCALRRSGRVACWGDDCAGQYGAGAYGGPDEPPVVREVSGVSDAVAIQAGDGFSCARRRSGAVSCWGTTSGGRLGNGALLEHPPTRVPELAGATQLAVGYQFTCALDTVGRVACLGAPEGAGAEGRGQRRRGCRACVRARRRGSGLVLGVEHVRAGHPAPPRRRARRRGGRGPVA